MTPTDVYLHYAEDGELLYVGISLSAIRRLSQHYQGSAWYKEIHRVEIYKCPSREAAELVEQMTIKQEKPRYNRMHNPPDPNPKIVDMTDADWEALALERRLNPRAD